MNTGKRQTAQEIKVHKLLKSLSNTPLYSAEKKYMLGKCAEWLCKALDAKVSFDDDFFSFLESMIGNLRPFILVLIEETEKRCKKNTALTAFKESCDYILDNDYNLRASLDNLANKYPFLKGIVEEIIRAICADLMRTAPADYGQFYRARQQLCQLFGISQEAGRICEFIYFLETFSDVERYFEDNLKVHRYDQQRLFAHILGLNPSQVRSTMKGLCSSGLIRVDHRYDLRLQEGIADFWGDKKVDLKTLFCRPLEGKAIPLENFALQKSTIEYVKTLLERTDDAPVHILLYGPSGTGKTSFARSLARECGLRAWSVTSRDTDKDDNRRASLTACLNMASKYPGAFVLVDEAERILDTARAVGIETKDKAWLNDFLEQRGRRIIWITNDIAHIDQAVRRRFSFSIYFERLGNRERRTIWRQILTQHRVKSRITEDTLEYFIREYPVAPAIMEKAVVQAKMRQVKIPQMSFDDHSFTKDVECFIQAYTTLRRNGAKPRIKPQAVSDFSLEGVCIEGSVHDLLASCRRVDNEIRAARVIEEINPGCATMLFYGPPGTGKTALARYIAKTLDRECIIKRASDLLSMWVGQTEQFIADAFRTAEREGAVLVFDEADSFIYSRDIAQQAWESTQVNEFLTALEECRCFCVCTTNRRENLDAAAMRRFAHKLPFGYAKPPQVKSLYMKLLQPLCNAALSKECERDLLRLECLTPGDFHAVRSQYRSSFGGDAPAHETLIDALKKEQTLKVEKREHRIGF